MVPGAVDVLSGTLEPSSNGEEDVSDACAPSGSETGVCRDSGCDAPSGSEADVCSDVGCAACDGYEPCV